MRIEKNRTDKTCNYKTTNLFYACKEGYLFPINIWRSVVSVCWTTADVDGC